MTVAVQERIQSLCSEFRLPTLGAEVVERFQAAEHGSALETLLAVMELEASDRRQRRVERMRRAAKLPAGKVWEELDLSRFPVKLQQQLEDLATGDFVDQKDRPADGGTVNTLLFHPLRNVISLAGCRRQVISVNEFDADKQPQAPDIADNAKLFLQPGKS